MYHRILVPFDGSATSERGLTEAIRIASGQDTKLVLLNVIDDFPKLREFAAYDTLAATREERAHQPDPLLAAAVRRAGEAGVRADPKVVFAMVELPETVVETAVAEHCDLIVIGTHGRRGVPRALLGSVAEGVARRSTVPVLLVPPLVT
jgi:nucleotide-binding universal stress UspA family protein